MLLRMSEELSPKFDARGGIRTALGSFDDEVTVPGNREKSSSLTQQ